MTDSNKLPVIFFERGDKIALHCIGKCRIFTTLTEMMRTVVIISVTSNK